MNVRNDEKWDKVRKEGWRVERVSKSKDNFSNGNAIKLAQFKAQIIMIIIIIMFSLHEQNQKCKSFCILQTVFPRHPPFLSFLFFNFTISIFSIHPTRHSAVIIFILFSHILLDRKSIKSNIINMPTRNIFIIKKKKYVENVSADFFVIYIQFELHR